MRATGVDARCAAVRVHNAPIVALVVSLVAALLIVVVPSNPATAGEGVPGIDVSRWQRDVDWAEVVDLYAPASAFTTLPLASGLADDPHAVRIVVLGTHRAASAGSAIVLDRWLVI